MQEPLHIFVDFSPEMSIIPSSIFMVLIAMGFVGSKAWVFPP